MEAYSQAGVPLSINYTVTNNNLGSLTEVPAFFKEHGVSIINFHRASMSGNAYNNPHIIVQAKDWVAARDALLYHIERNKGRYAGLTFRIPYIFLNTSQLTELNYQPIQVNNYHSPQGGHRLIVLPPTSKGKGLCYMSSDLIGEPHAELGMIEPDGYFRWNNHPNNELIAFKSSHSESANISTIITGQEEMEHSDESLMRVSHSFKATLVCS
jgi:MoaA/NifB/PqqE/SkfB family radical SAM enzyme